jgi:hypothetical protein
MLFMMSCIIQSMKVRFFEKRSAAFVTRSMSKGGCLSNETAYPINLSNCGGYRCWMRASSVWSRPKMLKDPESRSDIKSVHHHEESNVAAIPKWRCIYQSVTLYLDLKQVM